MANITTGTADGRVEHSQGAAIVNVMGGMLVPVALALLGLISDGWGAIEWGSAIFWGVAATVVMTLLMSAAKATGMTKMDLLNLLGSVVMRPNTGGARALGGAIHLMNGALLGIGFAFAAALFDVEATWWSGLLWGGLLWVCAMWMMTSIGALHPAVRRGEIRDPGGAAKNFGRMTPVGSLVGHLVFGLVLGLGYQYWSF